MSLTREDFVRSLRAVADLVESTDLPLPTYDMSLHWSVAAGWYSPEDIAASVANMQAAAEVLGAGVVRRTHGSDLHHFVKAMLGPVEIHVSYVERNAARPTETAAGVGQPPADGAHDTARLDDGGAPAAVPAPVEGGDGAAVTPDVWVARRRRGIAFHQLNGKYGADYTHCGRAARASGHRLTQAEAEEFGAVPCDRCYGSAA